VRGLPTAVLLIVAGFVLAYAHTFNSYWMHVAIIAIFYGILTASWSLLAGYAGLFSLGHMAFASVGGYSSALLVQWSGIPVPLGMAVGVAVCCVLGGWIGWVCLRMTGPYLAIFTLAFSEIVRITVSTEDQVTRGMTGLHTVPLFGSASRLPYFYTAFGLLACCIPAGACSSGRFARTNRPRRRPGWPSPAFVFSCSRSRAGSPDWPERSSRTTTSC